MKSLTSLDICHLTKLVSKVCRCGLVWTLVQIHKVKFEERLLGRCMMKCDTSAQLHKLNMFYTEMSLYLALTAAET